jgi:hypothetical protein
MTKKELNPQKQLIQEKKQALIALTDAFSAQYLDAEYRDMCEHLILKLSRKRTVPFLSGRLEIWAAAMIHALGTVNFLFDRSFDPYVSPADIAKHFGAAMSTVQNKSKQIRDMFRMNQFDCEFIVPTMAARNPFNNMVLVNGLITSVSSLPEPIQDFIKANPQKDFIFEQSVRDEESIQAQIERVAHILGVEPSADMTVSLPYLERFCAYLQTHLPWPFQVSGILEDPLFAWEKVYLEERLTKKRRADYEQLRQERPSVQDTFEVTGVRTHFTLEAGHSLGYEARRLSDQQAFVLPIHAVVEADTDLEQVEPLIDDYMAWMYNCHS